MSALDKFLKEKKVKPKKNTSSKESTLRDQCVRYVQKLEREGDSVLISKRWSGGYYTRSGLPDLEFWGYGVHLDIELKDDSGLSPLQVDKIKRIELTGNQVMVIDHLNQFKEILTKLKEDYINGQTN